MKGNVSSESINNKKESRVITSNSLKEKEDILKSQEKNVKNIHKRDMDVIELKHETGMKWKSWLLYFEGCYTDSKKDNILKIWNIQKFLKGKALTLNANNSLNVLHWKELVQLFNEEFTTSGKLS